MLAIIKTGGKQYIVKPGDKLRVEKLDKKEGEEFSFSDVLLVEKDKKIDSMDIELNLINEILNNNTKQNIKNKIILRFKDF